MESGKENAASSSPAIFLSQLYDRRRSRSRAALFYTTYERMNLYVGRNRKATRIHGCTGTRMGKAGKREAGWLVKPNKSGHPELRM